MGEESLQDSRLGQNKQHGLLPLLRQSIYGCLAGYEDVNDAEQLCVAPTMRHVVGGGADEYQDRPRNCDFGRRIGGADWEGRGGFC